jgi:hypothetical protein
MKEEFCFTHHCIPIATVLGTQLAFNKYLLNEQMNRNDKMLKKQGHDGMLDTLTLNNPMMRLKRNGQR